MKVKMAIYIERTNTEHKFDGTPEKTLEVLRTAFDMWDCLSNDYRGWVSLATDDFKFTATLYFGNKGSFDSARERLQKILFYVFQ